MVPDREGVHGPNACSRVPGLLSRWLLSLTRRGRQPGDERRRPGDTEVSRIAVSRVAVFENEEVEGIRGLTALTEPDHREGVGAVIDLAVIGARGDGKTQFIVHAIRTLRAYAPVLGGVEHEHNRDILRMVMNAREPCPDATAPGVVPHYVFRIVPRELLGQIGFAGRLALFARAAGLRLYAFLALLNAVGLVGLLGFLRGSVDAPSVLAGLGTLAVGLGLGWALARQRFLSKGETEIVFWDVAGEHVYRDSAADYYSFLSALVRRRMERAAGAGPGEGTGPRAGEGEREAPRTGSPARPYAYAFAPILICNPLSLGVRGDGSAYARLRRLIPLFATLGGRLARAMVAINRWSVVERICEPDSDRDEVVAVVPRARLPEDAEADADEEGRVDQPPTPRAALPVVQRDVVRRYCLDAEDGDDMGVRFTYLRYDAGIQCEFSTHVWEGYGALPEGIRSRWRAPSTNGTGAVLDYEYEEGPGSFEGDTRAGFLRWLATMAYGETPPAENGEAATLAAPRAADEAHKDDDDDAGWSRAEVPEIRWSPRGVEAQRALEEMTQAIDGALDEAEAAEASFQPQPSDEWGDRGTSPGIGPVVTPARPESHDGMLEADSADEGASEDGQQLQRGFPSGS